MSTANWRKTKAGYSLGLVAGIFKGFSLMILLPAIVSLAEQKAVLGFSFWGWMGILVVVGLLLIVIDFFGQRTAYIGGLGFMHDVHQEVGDKISKLPLGTFRADTAGILSRMVTGEMMNLASSVATFLYQNLNNVASLVMIALLSWVWD